MEYKYWCKYIAFKATANKIYGTLVGSNCSIENPNMISAIVFKSDFLLLLFPEQHEIEIFVYRAIVGEENFALLESNLLGNKYYY